MMNNLELFDVILKSVKAYFVEIKMKNAYPNCRLDILNEKDDYYQVYFEFDNCIGEVLVNQAEFAPYRFVKVEILSSKHTEYEQVFVWLDEERDGVEDVIFQISRGLEMASTY